MTIAIVKISYSSSYLLLKLEHWTSLEVVLDNEY